MTNQLKRTKPLRIELPWRSVTSDAFFACFISIAIVTLLLIMIIVVIFIGIMINLFFNKRHSQIVSAKYQIICRSLNVFKSNFISLQYMLYNNILNGERIWRIMSTLRTWEIYSIRKLWVSGSPFAGRLTWITTRANPCHKSCLQMYYTW